MNTLYAVVTTKWKSGDVAGTLYDHEGTALHGHMSSCEDWLWRDLTTGFSDRAKKLDELYPEGYEVIHLGSEATEEDFEPLYALWDKNYPGWREGNDERR